MVSGVGYEYFECYLVKSYRSPRFVEESSDPLCVQDDYSMLQLGGLRWPNTVFARAFADAIECAHKDCKERSFYLHNTRTICAIFSLLLNAVY